MIRKSLSDFASDREAEVKQSINDSCANEELKAEDNVKAFSQQSQTAEQTAEQILHKYSRYSKTELEDEIKGRVASLKESGQFDKEKLLGSFSLIEGFLSPEQRAQMISMIEGLDEKN